MTDAPRAPDAAPRAGKVLEIGCLHGNALFGLGQWGYEVEGADINKAAREFVLADYTARAASSLVSPFLALMDRRGKGLILFATGRKQGG